LETCDSYDAAIRVLGETKLSTSVFYTVCGTEKGQACVIERTRNEAAYRPLTSHALVQANHHVANPFAKNNVNLPDPEGDEEEFSLEGSSRRAQLLSDGLAEMGLTCPLDQTVQPLNIDYELNRYTCQQMVFCPRSGEVKLWRRCAG